MGVCLQAAIQAAGTALANINQQAVAIGSISLLCALYTPRAVAKFVPGSLIGLLAGTATAYFGKLSESAPPCLSWLACIMTYHIQSCLPF